MLESSSDKSMCGVSNDAPDDMSPISYRILKIAVVVMGILLMSGMALILFTIIHRAVNSDEAALKNMERSVISSYATDVSIPLDAVVGEMVLSDGVLALKIESAKGTSIFLYDVESGRGRGKINLVKE